MNILCASTTGIQPGDAPQGGASFGNQEDFPARACHFILYASWAILSHTQKYLISIDHERCLLTVLFAMLTAVASLQCTIALGCGSPSSLRVIQKIIPSLQLRKRALSLALAADAMANRRMAHKVKNAPLSLIGLLSLVAHPMKNSRMLCFGRSPWISTMRPSGRS